MEKDFLPRVISWFRLDEHVKRLAARTDSLETKVTVLEETPTSTLNYKVYTALLTQTGTDAPTAIVVENTLGTITFGYVSTGLYSINSPGLFTTNKTVAFLGATPSGSIIKTELISSNTVNIGANDGDDEMEKTVIEIRVYN